MLQRPSLICLYLFHVCKLEKSILIKPPYVEQYLIQDQFELINV